MTTFQIHDKSTQFCKEYADNVLETLNYSNKVTLLSKNETDEHK